MFYVRFDQISTTQLNLFQGDLENPTGFLYGLVCIGSEIHHNLMNLSLIPFYNHRFRLNVLFYPDGGRDGRADQYIITGLVMLPENVGVLGKLAHLTDIAVNIEFANATLESTMISVG